MANMVNVMNTTTSARTKFTVDQVIRAIRDGELPDGTIRDDEEYLKALGMALDSLSPDELEEVMEASGCDVTAADAIANEFLSDFKPVQAPAECMERSTEWTDKPRILCVHATGGNDPLRGFSLVHEVFHSAAAAAVETLRRCGGVVFLRREQTTTVAKITDVVIDGGKPPIGFSDGGKIQPPIDGRTQLPMDLPMLPYIWRRDRHVEGD
jgi:hypothetical protein